ncbi:hypothetical protein [Xanthomonas floridensis]|uniref:Transposase n=1 Tax=Xanthomonas floridensis TaxID=1843580 RepID=A0ABU5Q433_9XANT|nr:hypothetical protein [Xanthomonas floridensis]MEA5126417.1 hypothetical protein [Xanthomonas floridensis]MEA5134365.1 hypothetical protein [Xanthomonas floridensis]
MSATLSHNRRQRSAERHISKTQRCFTPMTNGRRLHDRATTGSVAAENAMFHAVICTISRRINDGVRNGLMRCKHRRACERRILSIIAPMKVVPDALGLQIGASPKPACFTQ